MDAESGPRESPLLEERAVGRTILEEVAMAPGLRLYGHVHDEPHLCFVLRGGFNERGCRGDVWCGPGTLRVSPAGDRHDLDFGAEGARCLLVVSPPELDGEAATDGPRRYLEGPWIGRQALALRTAAREVDAVSALAVEGLLLEVLAQVARPRARGAEAGPAPWLERVREALREDLASPPTLEELAAICGRHRVSVARAFRQHYGCSVGAYVRRERAERARQLIRSTDAPLADVAAQVGFADQSHMTRQLRRWMGTTPGRLRKAVTRRLGDPPPR